MAQLPVELLRQIVKEVRNGPPCGNEDCTRASQSNDSDGSVRPGQGRCVHLTKYEGLLGGKTVSLTPVRNVIFSFEEYGEYVERLPMDDERNMPDDIMDDFMRVAHSSAYDWTDEEMSRLISGYVDAEATLLLQLLPNVVSLDLDFPTWDLTENESHQEQGIFRHDLLRKYLNQTHEEISDGESFLASLERFYMPNPYQAAFTLKSAYPPCWYWDITELPGVFSFPHLKSLSLERCASSGDKTLYIVGKRGGIGKLEELSITEAALEACDLDWILTLPNALKSFKYAVPRLDELFEDCITSPRLVFEHLTKQKHSLERLELSTISKGDIFEQFLHFDDRAEFADWDWEANDDEEGHTAKLYRLFQPLDLHDFKVLKSISLHVLDLLGVDFWLKPGAHGKRLVDVLPSSLETLILSHECDLDIPKYYSRYGPGNFPYYDHMTGLLDCKTQRFGRLRRVVLSFEHEWPDCVLVEHAAEVGVELEIRRFRKRRDR
ncbi:hypothetical protein H2203_006022 [Taxawa tesnikishii (nom. ined.)]|nr:hypothetical protein H2203_006022 [Dothideales sp. JES 119]